MPGGDGRGPLGQGPMTGRGAGLCAGYSAPGYANSGAGGRGCQRGWFGGFAGRGRGYRNQFLATGLTGWMRAGMNGFTPFGRRMKKEDEAKMLRDQLDFYKNAADEINKRIKELESGGE
ncbi:MAG: DUF5320 domain-containing protein [Spirochaetes bacterium]|nr:DUF5320 domain-containing protein [Spirochaetota bacterium]